VIQFQRQREISSSSTFVLESSTANDLYNFRFGCFHHSSNFDAARKSEEFVTNLVKIDPVDLDSTKSTVNRSISKISFSCFEEYGIDVFSAIRFFKLSLCLDEFAKLYSKMLIQSPEKTVVCTATTMVKFPLDSSDFRFDPGGIMTVIYSLAFMLSFLSIFDSISLFPFDPGGI
jgi:hypothetical protein